MKRVLAIHDLSCLGRCSLSVIIPILSNMGFQVCPLPTAIFSTHLGGFSEIARYDFTPHMADFSAHWRREEIDFDCIYSGFLASEQQIDLVSQIIDDFSGNHPLVLVDPVMGDEGKLYSIYTPTMQEKIKTLIRKADIITPNFTEACFLLNQPYRPQVADGDVLKPWLLQLSDLGPPCVVLTGVPLPGNRLANLGYDRNTRQFWQSTTELVPAKYPGTGDVFASVLLGELLRNSSLPYAITRAGTFVSQAVRDTFTAGAPPREGILLERTLNKLLEARPLEY
jgi:pyridoxine kinase